MGMSALGTKQTANYRLKQILIFVFFICYTFVGFGGYLYSPRGEYFPVFSWSLFSVVKTPWETVELEIIRIGDTEFAEPINYFDLHGYFRTSDDRSTAVRKAYYRLLKMYLEDAVEAERMRPGFESLYLSGHGPVTYQFVHLWYEPLARARSGEVLERKVFAQFSTEQTQ